MSQNKTPERIDLDELAVEQRNPLLRSLLRKASRYQAHLEAENRRLTSELEEERRCTPVTIAPGRITIGSPSVPRVITADEIKDGQIIAWQTPDGVSSGPGAYGWEIRQAVYPEIRFVQEAPVIVLLEDAPAEESEPIKEGDSVRTVAELDGLADGSVVLDYFDDAHQKADGVWWEAARREERDAAGMLTYGPFTVLYLPEEDA